MPKRYRLIPVVFFLLGATPAFSQADTSVMDSVSAVIEAPADGENDTTVFLPAALPSPVAVRKVPQKELDSLKASDDFWYANAVLKKKKPPVQQKESKEKSLLQQRWFSRLLWMIVLSGFLAAVIWYLQSSNVFLFRKRSRKIRDVEPMDVDTEDIFAVHYATEIRRAEEAQNYRLAIRLHYLQTLKQLGERKLIEYTYGATNYDNVIALSGSEYASEFRRLTRNFEYTWYGQFKPSAELYTIMRRDFSSFQKMLR